MKSNILKNHWGFYTEPTLVSRRNSLEKDWMIQFYFAEFESGKHPHDFPPIQRKSGINYGRTVAERTRLGNEARKEFKDLLAIDWHPRLKVFPTEEIKPKLPHDIWLNKTIEQALADVFEQKAKILRPNSLKDYRGALDYFIEAMYALNLRTVKMSEVRRSTILTIYEAYSEIRSATERTYNKNLGYIKALFSVAADYCEMDYSPAAKLKEKETYPGEGYISPTDAEMALIRSFLEHSKSKRLRHFFIYLHTIYQTGIRCDELLALQIKDINFQARTITIFPERARNNSKTKKKRVVAINDYAWEFLEKLIKGFPVDYYIFGSPCKAGKGWTGVTCKEDFFQPSSTRMKIDYATKLWRKMCDVLHRHFPEHEFRCHMYALKHKGGDDKYEAGVSQDAIKEGFGHSEKRTTRLYIKNRNIVYDREIRERSPEWVKQDPQLN